MVASSVLVMGSLTATGLWLGTDRGSKDEGYVVDLSAIALYSIAASACSASAGGQKGW